MDVATYAAVLEHKLKRKPSMLKKANCGFTETELALRQDMAALKVVWYNSFFKDWWCFMRNTHPVMATCLSHSLHSVSKRKRFFVYYMLIALHLAMSVLAAEAQTCTLNFKCIVDGTNVKRWCCTVQALGLIEIINFAGLIGISLLFALATVIFGQLWFLIAACGCCQHRAPRERQFWERVAWLTLIVNGAAALVMIVYSVYYISRVDMWAATFISFAIMKSISFCGAFAFQSLIFFKLWRAQTMRPHEFATKFHVLYEDILETQQANEGEPRVVFLAANSICEGWREALPTVAIFGAPRRGVAAAGHATTQMQRFASRDCRMEGASSGSAEGTPASRARCVSDADAGSDDDTSAERSRGQRGTVNASARARQAHAQTRAQQQQREYLHAASVDEESAWRRHDEARALEHTQRELALAPAADLELGALVLNLLEAPTAARPTRPTGGSAGDERGGGAARTRSGAAVHGGSTEPAALSPSSPSAAAFAAASAWASASASAAAAAAASTAIPQLRSWRRLERSQPGQAADSAPDSACAMSSPDLPALRRTEALRAQLPRAGSERLAAATDTPQRQATRPAERNGAVLRSAAAAAVAYPFAPRRPLVPAIAAQRSADAVGAASPPHAHMQMQAVAMGARARRALAKTRLAAAGGGRGRHGEDGATEAVMPLVDGSEPHCDDGGCNDDGGCDAGDGARDADDDGGGDDDAHVAEAVERAMTTTSGVAPTPTESEAMAAAEADEDGMLADSLAVGRRGAVLPRLAATERPARASEPLLVKATPWPSAASPRPPQPPSEATASSTDESATERRE